MTVKLVSVQGEQRKNMPVEYVACRAFRVHNLDGHTFAEHVGGRNVWVARLTCDRCGTHRIDVMKPRSCELISRLYVHPDNYDGAMTSAEARKIIYKHMIDNGVSLSSLAG